MRQALVAFEGDVIRAKQGRASHEVHQRVPLPLPLPLLICLIRFWWPFRKYSSCDLAADHHSETLISSNLFD